MKILNQSIGLLGLAAGLLLSACSSHPVATKYNSPVMRVMIDPVGLTPEQLARLQTALVQSGKWIVVDRANGFDAAMREQERLHKKTQDRYEDREKYAHIGKMYGVGGIVVAQTSCERKAHFIGDYYNRCRQTMTLIHASTGEVWAASEVFENSEDGWNAQPSWEYAVDKFNDSIPKHFEHREDDELIAYKDLSEQHAKSNKAQPASVEESEDDGE